MVDAPSAPGTNSSRVPVLLQALLPNRTEVHCCSYDPNPSGPAPMTMETCRDDGGQYQYASFSQVFLYNDVIGSVEPWWRENSTVSSAPSNQTSQTPGNNTQSGDKNVRMIWMPLAQNGSARVEPGVETRTVTVTVTAGPETKSADATPAALRETSTGVADPTAAPASASSAFAMASPSPSQATTKNITPASSAPESSLTSAIPSGISPTQDGLKIEVIPNQTTASDSMIPSSSTVMNPLPTVSSSVASSVPARDGEVTESVLSLGYV
ncbi:hypothetical protein P691DRAFT_808603 [Macrolepiota fuliginosa MF-IS2]|uniref:Uncharacterized protein n=1 Tax=Macrolepiota fuliginosa MF-IS2 TaxID=1400762 RepID=A0A9P5XRN8_9AGAR|nr:hypothetical protein P691DRAFT_808603 [Macrolepiota fuliginosa MF-IS2]